MEQWRKWEPPPIAPGKNEGEKDGMEEFMQEQKRRQKLKKDCREVVRELEQSNSNPQNKEKYGESFKILFEEFSKFNSRYQNHEDNRKRNPGHCRHDVFGLGVDNEQEKSLSRLFGIYEKFKNGIKKGNITEAQKELGAYRKLEREKNAKVQEEYRAERIESLEKSIADKKNRIVALQNGITEEEKMLKGLKNL